MTSKFTVIEKVRKYVRNYRFNLWLLDGIEKHSGEKLSIVYAGHRANKNYICHLAFQGKVKETDFGIIWLWTALRLHTKYPDTHLIILEIDQKVYKRFSDNAGVYIPCWINGELYFEDVINKCKTSENIKSDIRKIRKSKLEYEVTKNRELVDKFYYQMYVPHITKVHQDRALLMSHMAMINKLDKCDLLLIKMGDEYIAGELLIYENDTVRAWSIGVKDGDTRYVKAGTVGAFYYFRTQYLADKGYKSIQMGASRAFLRDGVFQYKKKWGMRLTSPRDSGFWLRTNMINDVVTSFLTHNPFIFLKGDIQNGAVFLSNSDKALDEIMVQLNKAYFIDGMEKLNVYLFMNEKKIIEIPDELADRVAINLVSSLF